MAERAAIYHRHSTMRQLRDGYSITDVLRLCREKAERQSYMLVGDSWIDPLTGYGVPPDTPGAMLAYVDTVPGSQDERPMLNKLKAFTIAHGLDAVIFHMVDRVTRNGNVDDMEKFFAEEHNVKVEYVWGGGFPEGAIGRHMKREMAVFASLEQELRVERATRGKVGKARRGIYVGGRPPYGYTADKSVPGGLAVNETEAEGVRWIFEEYVHKNNSIRDIAQTIADPSKRPLCITGYISRNGIRKMLRNETYIGTAYYNMTACKGSRQVPRNREEWIAIEVAPLVDKEIFALAQVKLDNNRETLRRRPTRDYLLSRMVVCAECGKCYGPGGAYYNHRMAAGHCRNHRFTSANFEAAVWEAVTGLLLDPASLIKGYEHSLERQQSVRERKQEHLEKLRQGEGKLNRQLDTLLDVYTAQDITRTRFLEGKARYENALQKLAGDIETLEAELASIPGPAELANLETYAADIKEFLEEGIEPTFEEKRKILEMLHTRVVIETDGSQRIEGWFGPPVRILSPSSRPRSIPLPHRSIAEPVPGKRL